MDTASIERFSPISHLDPISAAQIPATAAIALLSVDLKGRLAALRPFLVTLLVAGSVLPGSRGPLVAIVLALVATILLLPPPTWPMLVPAVVVGLVLGFAGASQVGSGEYISSALTGTKESAISTVRIREEWWKSAVKGIPDAPLAGHGVAMFVDNTPEARRMGIFGTRTYPHNSPLESLYSLGLLGAIPYIVFIVSPLVALVLLASRRTRAPAVVLSVGLWTLAFANANVSGEIGADAMLWSAGALAVGLYTDATASRYLSSNSTTA